MGAGFSRRAGLPLADELWLEVMRRVRQYDWIQEDLDWQLSQYAKFRSSRGDEVTSEELDFEDFLGFLDLEHALGLKGSDHFGDEGNELQIVIKWTIAQIIVERTPPVDQLPRCYSEFANLLQPGDYVLTFNYDNILESVLEAEGKDFRLFTNRYEEIHESYGVGDSSRDEIVVLKLHGSVDWFDRAGYEQSERQYQDISSSLKPKSLVFGPNRIVETEKLLEGPQFPDDSLDSAYRVVKGLRNLYLRRPPMLVCPILLAPSSMKVLYARRLRYFFWGLGQAGGMNLGLAVIGYSLPRHDDYARLFIMRMFANYQGMWWDADFSGMKKTAALIIDFRPDTSSDESIEDSFGFSDPEKTVFFFGGFDSEAISLLNEGT